MLINGFDLRGAIVKHGLARDAAQELFSDSLKKFPGEEKPDPRVVMEDQIIPHERAIAALEVAQAAYNQRVQVQDLTLAMAVKLLGVAVREMKAWMDAMSPLK